MSNTKGLINDLPKPPEGKTGWPWTEETSPSIYDAGTTYPKISIITPSYNQGIYIEETIRAVLLQNYPNLEYIVIDGGSTDNTVEIIKKYEPWISYWVSEKDKGQSNAINKGINKATGKIFNWINSDDYFQKDALFCVGYEFSKNNLDALSGHCIFFSSESEKPLKVDNGIELKSTTEDSIFHHKMNQPATFFDLDKVKSLGAVNEALHYTMDFELLKKFLLAFTQAHFKETTQILSSFRIHESSKTTVSIDLFEKDKNVVRYSILYSLDAPAYLLQAFREKNNLPAALHPQKFLVNAAINRKKLLSLYFKKSPYFFYENRKYKEARQCINVATEDNFLKALFTYPGLLIKLYLFPSGFINFLRNLKN